MKKNVVLRYLFGFGSGIQDARPFPATDGRRLIFIAFAFWLAWTSPSSPLMAQSISKTFVFESSNKSLDATLKALGKASGFLFTYSMEQVGRYPRISIAKGTRNIEKTLSLLLENTSLSYRIKGKNILVFAKETPPKTSSDAQSGSQNKTDELITGTVKDGLDNPLLGVTVRIKNSTNAVTTDAEGGYTLRASQGDVLVYSFIGFLPKEEKVTEKTVYDVVLNSDSKLLDEVQIIGYGTTTKRLNTGNVATLKSEQIATQVVPSFAEALSGQLAGVSVTQSSGEIGAGPTIQIRGVNSLKSGVNPLIIVDGVIINNDPAGLTQQAGGDGLGFSLRGNVNASPWGSINPNDIASIDVLKDADATAIYGSRGSNGVILITTKKGTEGKMKVTVNAYSGINSATYVTPMLNTEQYLQMRKDAFATGHIFTDYDDQGNAVIKPINPVVPTAENAPDLTTWSQTAYTDWAKFQYGSVRSVYNADVNISGGSKQINYYATLGYFKNNGINFLSPYQERINGKINLQVSSLNQKFKLDITNNFSIENLLQPASNHDSGFDANAPNYNVYNTDGSLNFWQLYADESQVNALYKTPNYLPNYAVTNNSKTYTVMLSGRASYEIIKGLTAIAAISYNNQSNNSIGKVTSKFFPYYDKDIQKFINPQETGVFAYPMANIYSNTTQALNIEPQLTYSKTITKLDINALAGLTFLDRKNPASQIVVKNPGSDALLESPQSSNPTAGVYNTKTYYRYNSVFGRLTLNWDAKYLLNGTFRRDGSSRFGQDNRFANFYSIGGGWIFSSESFAQNGLPWLSFGKVRASYGSTGTDNIGDYGWTQFYGPSTSDQVYNYAYKQKPGLGPVSLPNTQLQWEKTNKLDASIEFGFLKDRLHLTATYYKTRSNNQLNSIPLSGQTGFASYQGNFAGVVDNRGWEFLLTTDNLPSGSPVKWNTSFNITFNKNKLVAYPGLETSADAYNYKIGEPVQAIRGLLFSRIDPATGLPEYVDGSGKVIGLSEISSNEANANMIANATPNGYGGLNNTVSYKNFTLDILVSFSHQPLHSWANTGFPSLYGGMFNIPKPAFGNYWKQPGDQATLPRLIAVPADGSTDETELQFYNIYLPYSSYGIWEGTFFRLKNVQLSYRLPQNMLGKTKIASCMLFLRGQNLAFANTGGKLWRDPEAQPLTRSVVGGIQFTF